MRYATVNPSALNYLHRSLCRESLAARNILASDCLCIGSDKAVTAALLARLAPKLRAKHAAQVDARIRRNHISAALK